MPVLIESLSLVTPRQSLELCWPGGAEAFLAGLPEDRRSDDGRLVAFAIPDHPTLARLERACATAGLVLESGGEFVDAAMIHQSEPLDAWCRWLELARVPSGPGGGAVMAARLADDERTGIAVPSGWRWRGSRSQRYGVGRLDPTERPLRFVRLEPGAAVYRDRFTGEELRLARLDPPVEAVLEGQDGARHRLTAEVVRDGASCQLGLMHRESLAPDAGMLFLFPRLRCGHFWMKNTLVPLDMLFLDEAGGVVELVERAAPLTLEPRGGRRRHQAVLEMAGGWIASHDVRLGDRLRW